MVRPAQAGAHEAFATYSSTWDHVSDILFHLALPLTALTLGLLANKFLIVRNTAIATLGEDYMVLARAKGLSRRLLKYRHSGRNVLLPFVTALGIQAVHDYEGTRYWKSNAGWRAGTPNPSTGMGQVA